MHICATSLASLGTTSILCSATGEGAARPVAERVAELCALLALLATEPRRSHGTLWKSHSPSELSPLQDSRSDMTRTVRVARNIRYLQVRCTYNELIYKVCERHYCNCFCFIAHYDPKMLSLFVVSLCLSQLKILSPKIRWTEPSPAYVEI